MKGWLKTTSAFWDLAARSLEMGTEVRENSSVSLVSSVISHIKLES
jgi:hypothetical protein